MGNYKVALEFIEPLLGTVPKNKDIFEDYILTKAPPDVEKEKLDAEMETVGDIEEKSWTGFHTFPTGAPFLYDYVIKGFFKDACSMLRRGGAGKLSSKLTSHKKIIDGLLFPNPRMIPLGVNVDDMSVLDRPLRAATTKGERVALARSDFCPKGTVCEFTLRTLGSAISAKLLREWLDYGRLRGLGQWRNAGYGAFTFTLTKVKA